MIDNKILGSVVFLALLGIAFLGNGITGMVAEEGTVLSEPQDSYTGQFIIGIIILVSIFFILYYSVHNQKD